MVARKMRLRSCKAGKQPLTTATSLLISNIQDLQNLKPILKYIYVLIRSYLIYEAKQGLYNKKRETENGPTFELEDTTTLSSVLLNKLHTSLSWTFHKASLGQDVGLALSEKYIIDSPEEMLLLLRCCCLVIRLHPHDHTVTQSFQDAVSLLRELYCQLISSRSVQSTDLSVHLVKQMVEVYVDEVFAERPFHECLAISESISSMRSAMQINSLLEVTAAHFLLSISGDFALQTFLKTLIWTEKRVLSRPELCLTVGLSLINHPVVMSAPVIVHSHLISLTSEVISTCIPVKTGLNVSRSKYYLSAFYDAVILYNGHFSKLMTSSRRKLYRPGRTVHRVFESVYPFEIFDKVNSVLVDMERAWTAKTGGTASSVISNAISYIKMNVHIIGEAYRDYVFTFMSSMISKVISAEIDELLLERIGEMKLQDVCLLASIIKLMSCSLLQATSDELLSESKQMLLDNIPLSNIMSCFTQCNLLPLKVQQFLTEGLKSGLSTYDAFKLMFLHFAGLLSLCMISGLGILVEGCLSFLLVIMNVLTRKEEMPAGSESPVHAISQVTSTSLKAASKFQRARLDFLRSQTSLEETCNGESYLRCFTNNSKDIAELADFVECKQGKNYASWLANRDKFRSKRLTKYAKLRRTRMTKVCRSLGY